MKRTLILILFFIFFVQAQNDGWQKTLQKAGELLVEIEYYEELPSAESISEGNKIKRRLNGIIVKKDGLVMTSSSIFRAQLDFTGSSIFGRAQLPEDIKVRFANGDEYRAEFVGKDDDKKIGFVKIISESTFTPFRFDDISFNAGDLVYIAYMMERSYQNSIMITEKRINAKVEKPEKKYLSDLGSFKIPGFALVCNFSGKPAGIITDNGGRREVFQFNLNNQSNIKEVFTLDNFAGLIKNPPEFEQKKSANKKWLGVNMQAFTKEFANYYNASDISGILVNTVIEDSPADKAGIEVGDVITAFNGQKIETEQDTDLDYFRNLVRNSENSNVLLNVWRDGSKSEINVDLSDIPISQFLADEVSNDLLGFSAKELTKDIILAKQLDFDTEGVWISRIERAGWADLAGLQIGDLLLRIDDRKITNLKSLKDYLEQIKKVKPEYISLFVKRAAETRFLFIETDFK